jgi:hypothetical protein
MERVFAEMQARAISHIFLEMESGNDRARAFNARSNFHVENSVWISAVLG